MSAWFASPRGARHRADNTVELTARLDRELDALQRELPTGMTVDRNIFRQASFIEVAVENVIAALRDGALLVVVIVVPFLANYARVAHPAF